MTASGTSRIDSLDAVRAVAMFAILISHLNPFREVEGWRLASRIIDNLTAFAVPVFFLVAGYLFGRGVQKDGRIGARWWKVTQRLAVLFAGWCLIYALFPVRGDWSHPLANLLGVARGAIEHPFVLLFNGTAIHLWFLPALWMGLSLVALGAAGRREQWLLPVGAILFIISRLGYSYAATPVGIPWPFPVCSRYGPMTSTLLVAIGFLWAKRQTPPRLELAWGLIVAGMALNLAESYWLGHVYHVPVYQHTTLFGRELAGVGVFWFALAAPSFGRGTLLPLMGRYTLGVYATHFLVMRLEQPLAPMASGLIPPLLWEPLEVVLVYLGAVALMFLLARIKLTQRLVY